MAVAELARAVFLDKDGTLVENQPFNVDPSRISLAPGVAEGLSLLEDAGYRLFVVTNQPGVAHGLFPESALSRVGARMAELFRRAGVRLAGFYYCPHHDDGKVPGYSVPCDCRKPKPGMVLRAAGEHRIRLQHSWMIGDILDDVEAGRSAGCRTVLIDNGNETEWKLSAERTPSSVVSSFQTAALRVITEGEG